jgi:hypothetical protein
MWCLYKNSIFNNQLKIISNVIILTLNISIILIILVGMVDGYVFAIIFGSLGVVAVVAITIFLCYICFKIKSKPLKRSEEFPLLGYDMDDGISKEENARKVYLFVKSKFL